MALQKVFAKARQLVEGEEEDSDVDCKRLRATCPFTLALINKHIMPIFRYCYTPCFIFCHMQVTLHHVRGLQLPKAWLTLSSH